MPTMNMLTLDDQHITIQNPFLVQIKQTQNGHKVVIVETCDHGQVRYDVKWVSTDEEVEELTCAREA